MAKVILLQYHNTICEISIDFSAVDLLRILLYSVRSQIHVIHWE